MYVRKKKDCEGPLLRNSTSSTVQCTCTVYMCTVLQYLERGYKTRERRGRPTAADARANRISENQHAGIVRRRTPKHERLQLPKAASCKSTHPWWLAWHSITAASNIGSGGDCCNSAAAFWPCGCWEQWYASGRVTPHAQGIKSSRAKYSTGDCTRRPIYNEQRFVVIASAAFTNLCCGAAQGWASPILDRWRLQAAVRSQWARRCFCALRSQLLPFTCW